MLGDYRNSSFDQFLRELDIFGDCIAAAQPDGTDQLTGFIDVKKNFGVIIDLTRRKNGAVGLPHALQAKIELVRPEPDGTVERVLPACHVPSGDIPLDLRVLPCFETLADATALDTGAIASGKDMWIISTKVVIHADAILNRQTCHSSQPSSWRDTNCSHNQICRKHPTVSKNHMLSRDTVNFHTAEDVRSFRHMPVNNPLRQRARHISTQSDWRILQHRHINAPRYEDCGKF